MKSLLTVIALTLSISSYANTAATAPAAAPKVDCTKEETFPQVTTAELEKIAAQKDAVVVDVNSADSFKKEHVTNAIHFAEVKNKFASVLPKDKNAPIVAYCGGPECGAWKKAATEACKMGYTNIKHYKEGIMGWSKAHPKAKTKS